VSQNNFCPDCLIWEVLPSDNYCSYCLCKFISIELEIHPPHLPAGEQASARLVIRNRSKQNPIRVERIRKDADWLDLDLSGIALPLDLKPGGEYEAPLLADTRSLRTATANIFAESSAGNPTASLIVQPFPEVRIEAENKGRAELILDESPDGQIAVTFEVVHGAVTGLSVAAQPAEICSIPGADHPTDLAGPGTGASKVFHVQFDKKALKEDKAPLPRTLPCRVLFRYADPFGDEHERGIDLSVTCWQPPRMKVWEENQQRVLLTGSPRKLHLTVQNYDVRAVDMKGAAPLMVRAVDVAAEDGRPLPWIVPKPGVLWPLRIEAGKSGRVEFVVYPKNAGVPNQPEAAVGEHILRFSFTTNLPSEHPLVHFRLIVKEPAEFQGLLALDFGTSNSCCALLDADEGQCFLGEVETGSHAAEKTKSPTLVQFLGPGSPEPATDYGAKVLSRLHAPETWSSVVQSVKRLLGRTEERDRIRVQFQNAPLQRAGYLPHEVATFYLRHLRHALEVTSGMTFKRLAVTHPARFRLGQIADLKQAVLDAFGDDVELTCCQEPIAAGLDHIVATALDEKLAAYTLGIFDCGGGTTDLTLIDVKREEREGITEVTATLLASTGMWFGGEDLTKKVLEMKAEKVRAVLEATDRAELFTKPDEVEEPELKAFAQQNFGTLWNWAEKAKMVLLYPASVQLPVFGPVSLEVRTANGAVEKRQFQDLDTRLVAADVQGFLQEKVEYLAGMLQDLMGRHKVQALDVLLLSGMTSNIPLIKSTLEKKFRSTKVILSKDPKHCVVKGACQLEAINRAFRFRFILNGRAATVSRIGYEDYAVVGTEPRFVEWVAAGQPIPDTGIEPDVRVFWISPKAIVRVLENDGEEDAIRKGGSQSRDITTIGRFRPTFALPSGGTRVEMKLHVSPDLECSLSGRVAGSDTEFVPFAPFQEGIVAGGGVQSATSGLVQGEKGAA
jgi:hypothetical protein